MPIKMSRIEQGVRTVLAFYDAFNDHDVQAMMALFVDDCLLDARHPAPDGDQCRGKSAVSDHWLDYLARVPSAQVELEDIVGMGNRCVARWKRTWHDNEDNPHHLRGADIFVLKGDLISEQRSYGKG